MRGYMDRMILRSFRACGVPARLVPADRTLLLVRGRDLVWSFAAVTLVATTYLAARLNFDGLMPLPLGSWLVVYAASLYLHVWYLTSIARAVILIRDLQGTR